MTKRTLEEHEAEALLLGLSYDPVDHTYNTISAAVCYVFYAEDISQSWDWRDYIDQKIYHKRMEMVKAGEIGYAQE